jgi:putative transposase
MSTRFRLSDTDCLRLGGVDYMLSEQTNDHIILRQVDHENVVISLAHDEIPALLDAPSTRYLRGHFSTESIERRKRNELVYLSSLPIKVREDVLWKEAWCKEFLTARKNGQVARTDHSIRAVLEKLNRQVNEQEDKWQLAGVKYQAGREVIRRCPPAPRTLRTWVAHYERGGYSPLILTRKPRRDTGSGDRLCNEGKRLLQDQISLYLSRQQPTKSHVARETHRAFETVNSQRALFYKEPLHIPSRNTVFRAIGMLDPFEVSANREGLDAAKRKYSIYENGITARVPLERVEIDEWQVDLLTIIGKYVDEEKLSHDKREELQLGRRWIYIAIDCATRCILGFRIASTPNQHDAVRTLELITLDKTPIAAVVGCMRDWSQHGGIGSVVTDQGSAFVSTEFKTALADIGSTSEAPPASTPKLRGTIERFFGTLTRELVQLLIGRTFSNSIERGDYPAEKLASLTDDDLTEIFTTFIVDVYHNKSHFGLALETPANAWKRLTKEFGLTPPPDAHMRRVAFGIEVTRKIGRHGVRVMGINYSCEEIQQALLRASHTNVRIKVDQYDLGYISICLGSAWFCARALLDAAHGVLLAQWHDTVREARMRFRDQAVIQEDVIYAAIERIKQCNASAMQRNRIKPLHYTAEQVERAERDLFLGLEIRPLVTGQPKVQGRTSDTLLENIIDADDPPNPDEPQSDNGEDWTFFDD